MKYLLDYTPPAPGLTVKLTRPFSSRAKEAQGNLDTGADITVLPQRVVSDLGLVPTGRLTVSSSDGREEEAYTYFVDVSFQSFGFPLVEVLCARRRDVLLDHDLINLLKVMLDGKSLSFELLDP